MAETVQEAQERLTTEIQDLLRGTNPQQDWSIGTVNYELIIKPLAAVFAEREDELTTLRNNMSLVQVLNSEDPDDDLVDALLSNYNVTRSEGSPGTGLINVFINSNQNVTIPGNATLSCAGVEIEPIKTFVGVPGEITQQDTTSVAYVQAVPYDDNTWVFSIVGQTVENLSTVLSAGTSCEYNISSPFLSAMLVGSTFIGGSGVETTESLLRRAQIGINSKVTTGRANIKSLLDTNEVVEVIDINVFGFGDQELLRDTNNAGRVSSGGHVDIYVQTTPVPSTAIQRLPGTKTDGVWTIEIPQDMFPGAYAVLSVEKDGAVINTGLDHVLGFTVDPDGPDISEPIHARYSQYQTLTVQFAEDTRCPPEPTETEGDFDVTVLFMAGLKELQEFMEGVDIRSYSFDTLIKGAIPVIINADINIEYEQGVVPPTEDEIAQAVCDAINVLPMDTDILYSSVIIHACMQFFSSGEVRTPINMYGRVFLPDGSQAYTTSNDRIRVNDMPGLTTKNSAFFCYPTGLNITLTEVSL